MNSSKGNGRSRQLWKTPLIILVVLGLSLAWSALPPDLPGVEVPESMSPRTIKTQGRLDSAKAEDKTAISWTAPSVGDQLGLDKTLMGMNRGSLFVPRMTEGKLEPEIVIIAKAEKLDEDQPPQVSGTPGSRIPLAPGPYEVLVGSGLKNQRMSFHVEIQEA